MKKILLLLTIAFCLKSQAQIITTVAGTGAAGYSGDGGQATAAKLNASRGVSFDTSGNIIITDMANDRIRKINITTGVISTIAGNGYLSGSNSGGYFGDNGSATAAALYYPMNTVYDNMGNLYIADTRNSCIRKVDSGGIIYTIAGNGITSYSGDGGAATDASLNWPTSLAFDNMNNLFFTDMGNNLVRKIDINGIITSVVGSIASGTVTIPGDGGPATSAQLNSPTGLAFDSHYNLYIADGNNNVIRKVDAITNIITTVAGNYTSGFNGDGGAATAAELNSPSNIVIDEADNIYVSDFYNNRIRKITLAGIISTFAGGGSSVQDGVIATSALINQPVGISFGKTGDLYYADYGNRIKKIELVGIAGPKIICSGQSTTLTASGANSYTWMPGNIISNSLTVQPNITTTYTLNYSSDCFALRSKTVQITVVANPTVSLTGLDSVYYDHQTVLSASITMVGTQTVTHTWSSNAGGKISTSLMDTVNIRPLATDNYALITTSGICVDTNKFTVSIYALPIINTIAGNGTSAFGGDGGPAISSTLLYPYAITCDNNGNLLFTEDHRLRKINTAGIITTIAGTGSSNFSGDGGSAISAGLSASYVTCDKFGNIYFTDGGNIRIRKIDTAGIITTVAGNGNAGYSGDGGAATNAQLYNPNGIATDTLGNLYIADNGNFRIRKVNVSNGIITTIAGNGVGGPCTNNVLATSSSIFPMGLCFDKNNNLYVSDNGECTIKKINTSGIIKRIFGNGISCGQAGDGGLATSAIGSPLSVYVDSKGNIFETENAAIRIIDSSGYVYRYAGTDTSGYSGDGGLAVQAKISYGREITMDKQGNLCFVDVLNSRIRKIGLCNSNLINISGNTSTCVNSPPVLLTASGATSYSWSTNTGGVTTNTVSLNPSTSTSYTVTGTSGVCVVSKAITITVSSPPTVIINGSSVVCLGNQVVLSASGASMYNWSTNATTPTITVSPAATISYSVTGSVGTCTSSAVLTVTVNIPTTATITPIGCNNVTVNSTTYSSSGTYLQNLANMMGCDSTLTINVTINAAPVINYTLTQDVAPQTWDAYPTYPANIANASWDWGDATPPSNSFYPSHTYAIAGRYNICVTVTDSNGCSSTYCQNDSVYRLANTNSTLSSMVAVNVLQNTTGISQISGLNAQISVYPNPSNGNFIIKTNSTEKQTLQLYDINGRVVLTQTVQVNLSKEGNSTVINASQLAEGIYNLSIISNAGVINKRLVIVR